MFTLSCAISAGVFWITWRKGPKRQAGPRSPPGVPGARSGPPRSRYARGAAAAAAARAGDGDPAGVAPGGGESQG